MKEFKGCKNYTLLSREHLEDINADAFVLKHDKTGARVVLIQNGDENKSFVIGFKTPQNNSTGVPHILEHSVLCGSSKYPVKDAMTEIMKGSLNTFLNAFTYPDRTLYPLASCNDKDFKNLMAVYLDSVFYPRVYTEPKIFMQEGWHYEVDPETGELIYNGVVYNEMKGVYSSPESALSSYIMFSMFPDTQYGVESGGDPEFIPDLSYEDFVAFHKKLYHPSNSRIFLYGDMDFEERLEYIDREYLSKFEALEIDSEVKLQKPFEKPIRVVKEYPVSDNEDTKGKTFLSYNVVCSDYTDVKTTEVMEAINYALCTVPGAKLKQRLLDAGIGKDVYSDFITDICQKVFSIIAQDADPEDEDKFVKIIEDTLNEIISEGFDKKTLEAAITSQEFTYKEADYSYYPKGIAYGMMTFDDWNYTDDDIFSNFKCNALYKELREGVDEGLFEKVLKERVLLNPHKTILIMEPKKGLQQEKDEKTREKLKNYKASLSEKELDDIVKKTEELKKYQEEPDSEEALKTIPFLKLGDIEKKGRRVDYEVRSVNGVKEIFTEVPSNGIAYFTLGFDITNIPARLLPSLSILKILLCMVDTKSYKYGELINESNIVSGGISVTAAVYKDACDTDKYTLSIEARSKAFYESIKDTLSLIKEILFTSKLTDTDRVREVLGQSLVHLQGFMISSGHAVAISRAMSYVSGSSRMNEILSGLEQYRLLEELLGDFDHKYPEILKGMQEILSKAFGRNNMEISVGAEKCGIEGFERDIKEFIDGLENAGFESDAEPVKGENKCEGLSAASQVNYVALCGNYIKKGLEYSPRLDIVKNILSTDFLWNNVRILGGAYGCMCGFVRNGDAYFVSYRDPNLKKTLETYNRVAEYIEAFPDDTETLERYIITTIGDLDVPLTPSMKTQKAYGMYKNSRTNEELQAEREQVLSTTPADIRALSRYIAAICDKPALCTVGGEEILKKEGDVFANIVPLFTA